MTIVRVAPDISDSEVSHDIAISSRGQTYGFTFAKGGNLQRVPIAGTSQLFAAEQTEWNGGRGRQFFKNDPNGYYDAHHAWCLQAGYLFAVPQIRHAKGLRSEDTFMPGDGTDSTVWKSLFDGGTARYASVSFAASATYSAAYIRLIVRRVGTPGSLTVELNANSGGSPGTVLKTVTLAASGLESNSVVTLSHRYKFTFSATESLTAATTYHIKAYGASTDDVNNHWEVLADGGTSGGKTSTNNSSWSASGWSMYYRVCDTDVARRLKSFYMDGAWYVISINDDGTASKLYINGDRVAVTSATSTSFTATGAGWTASRWSAGGAWAYVSSGKGVGQTRLITANTTDTCTVGTWAITPDTTSRITIIHTQWWKLITTTGTALGSAVNTPYAVQSMAFIPMGKDAYVQRLTSAHVVGNETGIYSDEFELINNARVLSLWSAVYSTSKLQLFSIPDTMEAVTLIGKLTATKNIGVNDYWINRIVAHDKKLYVMKENLMYAVDGDNIEEKSISIKDMPSRLNGTAAVSQQSYLYWSWASSMERMIQNNASDVMNFKPNYSGLPSDRKAVPSSASNLLTWVMVAMDGGTSYYSSVLLWNDMGWMELIRGFEVGARIRDSFVMTSIEQRPRIWTCMDGDLVFQDMPLNENNPLQDSAFRYEHEFSLVTGAIDGNDPSMKKAISKIQFLCHNSMEYGIIGVDYQTDADVWTEKWTPLSDTITMTQQEILINMGKLDKVAYRIRAHTNAPLTPVAIEMMRVEGWKVDQIRHQWVGRFTLGHEQQTRRSENDHDPDEVEKWLLEIAQGLYECTLHSRVKGDHGRQIIVHAPSITRVATEANKWKGTISIMMRELSPKEA